MLSAHDKFLIQNVEISQSPIHTKLDPANDH